mgnify:CR=1 FL=1
MTFKKKKKKVLEVYWNETKEIEKEMEIFQAQYDDGQSHCLETWDKWYNEYLERLEWKEKR